ncbi:MAG: branched-chain amino acid ABC transporter substrate-binding protein [Dehalococcoidia bacterium]|nr:branched-chain amino acid ABC transporter substrate-binding protein [Dehalococcoidia bacterium]
MRRTHSKWFVLFAMLAAFSVMLAACGGDDDDDGDDGENGGGAGFSDAGYKAAGLDKETNVTIDAGQPIKIGISSALSGDVKGLGVPIADAAEAAGVGVEIKGHALQFVREDDLCSAEGGPAAAERLIQAGVVAVVGPICSGGTAASLGIYDEAGITHVSPSATSGTLTSPERAEGPYVTFFRTPVLNGDEAREQAKYLYNEQNAKKAFVIHDTDDYGTDLAEQFEKHWKDLGGEIVGSRTGFEKKQTDFSSVINNIKQAKPDVVYFAGFYAEATPFIQQMRKESSLKDTLFMGSDGVKNDEFIAGAKDAAEGAFLALPGTTGSEFETFAAKYKEISGGGDAATATFGAEAYDAASAIIKALEKVAKEDGGKLVIDLKALNEAIKDSDFDGASGKVSFGDNGDRAGAVVRIFKVVSGAYVQEDTGN